MRKSGAQIFNIAGFRSQVQMLWRHSLASGIWGKEIARMRRRNVESAFLCGLLHHIGKPVVLHTAREEAKTLGTQITWEEVAPLIDRYYIPAGQLLARKWKLPGPVDESISFYHRYADAPAFSESAMMTNLADILASFLIDPESVSEETVRGSGVFADLNLYPDDIEELLGKTDKAREVVEAMEV